MKSYRNELFTLEFGEVNVMIAENNLLKTMFSICHSFFFDDDFKLNSRIYQADTRPPCYNIEDAQDVIVKTLD